MTRLLSALCLMLAASITGACTVGSPLNELNQSRPELPAIDKIVLFAPDVQVFSFYVGGRALLEEDGAAVRERLRSGIAEKMRQAGLQVENFVARGDTEERAERQLVKLHHAISRARELHATPRLSAFFPLPTVTPKTAFDRPAPAAVIAADIPERHGTNYGMVVNVYDEQRTGGRVAGEFLVALLAGAQAVRQYVMIVSFCLFDLRDGNELWVHSEFSGTHNITTESTLANVIDSAVESLQATLQKSEAAVRP